MQAWSRARERDGLCENEAVYRLEPACVVFGIGNSLVLFGRKQHCAELVHTQRRATPAQAANSEWARCGHWEAFIVPGRIGSHTP